MDIVIRYDAYPNNNKHNNVVDSAAELVEPPHCSPESECLWLCDTFFSSSSKRQRRQWQETRGGFCRELRIESIENGGNWNWVDDKQKAQTHTRECQVWSRKARRYSSWSYPYLEVVKYAFLLRIIRTQFPVSNEREVERRKKILRQWKKLKVSLEGDKKCLPSKHD